MEKQKILKADCRFCGKEVFSYFKDQLIYNINNHETWCRMNPKSKKFIPPKSQWTRDPKTGKRIREK